MNMITGTDRRAAGAVTVDGRRIDEMSEEEPGDALRFG